MSDKGREVVVVLLLEDEKLYSPEDFLTDPENLQFGPVKSWHV